MKSATTQRFTHALHHLGALRPDAPLGVLDIGSNSVRLVGYSGSARTPLPIYNERAFCRLGESVAATGRIEGKPYALAIMTFHRFRAIAERLGIGDLAVFATAAVRDAENSAAFVAEAEDILGHKIRVLSGKEEAVFSADGVMMAIPGAHGIVADLGGGSLDLAYAYDNKTHHWATLPLGVLALREYAQTGNKSQTGNKFMAKFIKEQLAGLDWLAQGRDKPLYIVGGNWRNLAKIHMQHNQYKLNVLHHYQMQTNAISNFAGDIAALSEGAANSIAAASRLRRTNMPIAALVLKHLLAAIKPKQVIVSANAVREGVLYSLLQKEFRRLDPLLLACEEMAERLCKSAIYGHELVAWTDKLFTYAKPKWTGRKELERLRQAGCLIADLAWAAPPNFRAFMISRTVLTAPFVGINHLERIFLAHALAYRHSVNDGDIVDTGKLRLSSRDRKLARALGLSCRLAHSLSASLPGLLPHTSLKAGHKKLRLRIDPKHASLISPIIEKRLALVAKELDLQPIIDVKPIKAQSG